MTTGWSNEREIRGKPLPHVRCLECPDGSPSFKREITHIKPSKNLEDRVLIQKCWKWNINRNTVYFTVNENCKARAKGAQKCDQKPRSREARRKPRSREAAKPRSTTQAEKPRSREAEKPPDKPRSREAEKPPDKPRSREAAKPQATGQAEKPRSREAEEPPGKPRSREAAKPRSRRASREAEKPPEPPGKPRSREATGQAEKPRSHRTSWDSPGTPSEHYVASSPSQVPNPLWTIRCTLRHQPRHSTPF